MMFLKSLLTFDSMLFWKNYFEIFQEQLNGQEKALSALNSELVESKETVHRLQTLYNDTYHELQTVVAEFDGSKRALEVRE